MSGGITRRQWLAGVVSVAAATVLAEQAGCGCLPSSVSSPSPRRLPRWRGFNLTEKLSAGRGSLRYSEEDFARIREWGFDFVRLPLSYRCWSDPTNWQEMRESVLEEIDEAVEFGRRYGVHVCLNFHHAPGYSVAAWVKEPFNLWTDAEALDACCYQWQRFAARYRDVSNERLSFNLINEPGATPDSRLVDDATYYRVAKALVDGIRSVSPERLIIADGLYWARIPCPSLAKLNVAQSTRGYDPMEISHWRAPWIPGSSEWPTPSWPMPATPEVTSRSRRELERMRSGLSSNSIVREAYDPSLAAADWDGHRIDRQLIKPWKILEAGGTGVHVGEFGAHNLTPHDVALQWMAALLSAWKEAGWGWALWNLRGSFGVLDSERTDVAYENYRGHKLDRKMLELLRAS